MVYNQTCQCGSETYHIKVEVDFEGSDAWGACTECGRPTATFEGGREKQREWEAKQD